MGLYLCKDYLDYEDVAQYLTDKNIYNFNINKSYDQQKLIQTIFDFVISRKIEPVFHYFGKVDIVEKQVLSIDRVGNLNTHNIYDTNIKHNITTDDYFFITTEIFHKLFSNKDSNKGLVVTNQSFATYHESGTYDCTKNKIMFYHRLKEAKELNFFELRYPKYSLDKIFNKEPNNLQANNQSLTTKLEQAHAKIAELEKQLTQTKQNTPTNDEITELILNYDEIKAVKEIYNRFWVNDKEKNRLQHTVIDWITTQYPSINQSMAKFLDKIVRQKYNKK